jgi:hypothetical protein
LPSTSAVLLVPFVDGTLRSNSYSRHLIDRHCKKSVLHSNSFVMQMLLEGDDPSIIARLLLSGELLPPPPPLRFFHRRNTIPIGLVLVVLLKKISCNSRYEVLIPTDSRRLISFSARKQFCSSVILDNATANFES